MQTSALPTTDRTQSPDWPQAEYTGTLLHAAHAATAILDGEGHVIPTLCMDLELDNAMHTPLHVEQPFPAGQHQQAEAAARRLKKGMRVTVQAPLVGMRLVARNATHIHVIHEPAAPAAPTPNEKEPELWPA